MIESKEILTKRELIRALQKFSKLCKLSVNPNRAPASISGSFKLDYSHILKVIFCFKKQISNETFVDLLLDKNFYNVWDIIAIVPVMSEDPEDSLIILNSRLPIVKDKIEPFTLIKGYALTRLIFLILTLLPSPMYVNASQFFLNYLFR